MKTIREATSGRVDAFGRKLGHIIPFVFPHGWPHQSEDREAALSEGGPATRLPEGLGDGM